MRLHSVSVTIAYIHTHTSYKLGWSLFERAFKQRNMHTDVCYHYRVVELFIFTECWQRSHLCNSLLSFFFWSILFKVTNKSACLSTWHVVYIFRLCDGGLSAQQQRPHSWWLWQQELFVYLSPPSGLLRPTLCGQGPHWSVWVHSENLSFSQEVPVCAGTGQALTLCGDLCCCGTWNTHCVAIFVFIWVMRFVGMYIGTSQS